MCCGICYPSYILWNTQHKSFLQFSGLYNHPKFVVSAFTAQFSLLSCFLLWSWRVARDLILLTKTSEGTVRGFEDLVVAKMSCQRSPEHSLNEAHHENSWLHKWLQHHRIWEAWLYTSNHNSLRFNQLSPSEHDILQCGWKMEIWNPIPNTWVVSLCHRIFCMLWLMAAWKNHRPAARLSCMCWARIDF